MGKKNIQYGMDNFSKWLDLNKNATFEFFSFDWGVLLINKGGDIMWIILKETKLQEIKSRPNQHFKYDNVYLCENNCDINRLYIQDITSLMLKNSICYNDNYGKTPLTKNLHQFENLWITDDFEENV